MNRIYYYFALFIIILFTGCATGIHERKNCICLIDYSGSLSDKTLYRYINIISENILGNLREKDRLIVLPIDEGAKIEPVKLVYEDFAQKTFSFHTDGYAHAKDSLSKRLNNYIKKLQPEIARKLRIEKINRSKYTYLSDIFSAIEQAVLLLERNEPDTFWDQVRRFISGKKRIVSTNIIFIFSDMIQESGETSFAGPEGCSIDEARFIIDKLNNFNRVPNLEGCLVFVNGRTGNNNQQIDNIKEFWVRYFKESKATLAAYDYDVGHEISAFLKRQSGH